MYDDDQKLLNSFEHIFQVLNEEVNSLNEIKSIHVQRIRQWENEIRAYARILEDISLPSRFILEHILELRDKSGQMAVEAENITQGFSVINDVEVKKFGVIWISLGTIELSWRDEDYNYLLYPDKVELRTIDEKAMIKFFFPYNFSQQYVQKFSEIISSPKLLYIHPVLQKYLETE